MGGQRVVLPAELDTCSPGPWTRGSTGSPFQGGNFHEMSFDDVIVLTQPWYNFSQTVTDKALVVTFPKMMTFQF